ncbi:hypothetical protein HPB49_015404 [Dermacentor silvarum]|uniref:Uncharacterized protein n=1 Tax=Dermacentor silvarum TaxID=543639 RepID=A0ACB8CRV9_DERSI|nr:hypothetical protein HPB49_015404 [Dermacentor silvarum]
MTSVLQPMGQGVIEITHKLYRKNLLQRILLSYENGKGYEIDILGAVHLPMGTCKHVLPLLIANCFNHAGFCREAVRPQRETEDFSGCDQLCE